MKIFKILFLIIIGITLLAGPVHAAPQKKGGDKGKVEKPEKGREKKKVERPGSNPGSARKNQPGNIGRSFRGAPAPKMRRKLLEKTRNQANARANIPDREVHGKGVGDPKAVMRKSARKTSRRGIAPHKRNRESRVFSLLKALASARMSYKPGDKKGEENKGRFGTVAPGGADRVRDRKKSGEGSRPNRGQQPKETRLDFKEVVEIEFDIQDNFLNHLKRRLKYYLSYAQTNHYMTRWVEYYQAAIENHLDTYGTMIRVNEGDTINYSMTFSPPREFQGKKLKVTTRLTSLKDYQFSETRDRYNLAADSLRTERPKIGYRAGRVLMEQTQEVVLGSDNGLSFSYDPPQELAGTGGLSADLSVTITDPVSGHSHKMSFDRPLYLYRSPYGKVTNARSGEPIVGVKITVHFEDGSIAALDKASNPTASNPQTSDATGRYKFKLDKNRKYYITATAPGYQVYTSNTFTGKSGGFRENLELIPIKRVTASY